MSRLTTELADTLNILFNSNVRQIWGAGNWPDLSIWGEARFAGDLLTYPNDLSQTSVWTATNLTVTANSIANPADNRVTANKIMETSATGLHAYNQTVTAFPNTNYQASVYARPNGRNYIALNVVDGAGGALVFFDVQGGTIGAQSGVTSANIQQCPNGFFLCTVTFTSSATCSSLNYRVALSTDGITTSYAGDRKSTRLNSSHVRTSRMPSSA